MPVTQINKRLKKTWHRIHPVPFHVPCVPNSEPYMLKQLKGCLLLMTALLCTTARGDEIKVAVAANFTAPMKVIAEQFERQSGHKVLLSFGGTGQFYAQIRNGAPFQILLAADTNTPAKLEEEGLAVPGSRFTYAIGKLVLWSAQPGLIDHTGHILTTDSFQKIAIANPKLAPYGAAAVQVMNTLGVATQLAPKIVEAANIGQTFQYVASGNAPLGFVALSQVYADGRLKEGSGWIIPQSMYSPIKQDAVLLKAGNQKPAAQELLNYLRTDTAREVLTSFGYTL